MDYLLDTNACIALINGNPEGVRIHFQKAIRNSQVFVSSIAVFELCYGVAKSTRHHFDQQRLDAFLAGPIAELSFDNEDGRFAGSVRAALEFAGKPIGAYDLLMAGQALRHQLTLVTANTSEFKRVHGLKSQDWAKS